MKNLFRSMPYLIILSPILFIIALIFGVVVFVRYWLYKTGIFKSYKVCGPVISVGGIELGGTGKTPFVIYLANKLIQKGFTPVILTRGYKRKGKGIKLVSNSDHWTLAGDEPFLIKKRVEMAYVVVGKRREISASFVKDKVKNCVFILDDGAQYLRIKKDINIFLISNPSRFFFPLGNLRDGKFRFKDADIILFKNAMPRLVLPENKKRFLFKLEPSSIVSPDFKIFPLENLNGKRVIGFSGLADNNDFKKMLMGRYDLIAFIPFPDHHKYSDKDIEKINKTARKTGADVILTTEKDIIKVCEKNFVVPVFAIRIEVKLENEAEFEHIIKTRLNFLAS